MMAASSSGLITSGLQQPAALLGQAVIASIGGLVCAVVATSLCLLRRFFTKQQGEYHTNEARDADRYNNADAAVAMGKTGQPEIPRKKEYFI